MLLLLGEQCMEFLDFERDNGKCYLKLIQPNIQAPIVWN